MTLYFEIQKDAEAVEDLGDRYRIRVKNPDYFVLMILKAMANPDVRFDQTESGDYEGNPYHGENHDRRA